MKTRAMRLFEEWPWKAIAIYLATICVFLLFGCGQSKPTAVEAQQGVNQELVDGMFAATSDGKFAKCRCSSFSVEGKKIAVLTRGGRVIVYSTKTGDELTDCQLDVRSIVFVSEDVIAGFEGKVSGKWKIWNLASNEVRDFICPEMNALDVEFSVGIIDRRRVRSDRQIFVSTGESVGWLDIQDQSYSKLKDWNSLAKILKPRYSHHTNPIDVAKANLRADIPKVTHFDGERLVFAFREQLKIALETKKSDSEDSPEWNWRVAGSNIYVSEGQYFTDHGMPMLTATDSLVDVSERSVKPYYGGPRTISSSDSRVCISGTWGIVIDFPTAKANKSDRDSPNRLLRISRLSTGEQIRLVSENENDLISTSAGVSDLQMSPCERFLSFQINGGSKFSRSIVWDLSTIIFEGKPIVGSEQ